MKKLMLLWTVISSTASIPITQGGQRVVREQRISRQNVKNSEDSSDNKTVPRSVHDLPRPHRKWTQFHFDHQESDLANAHCHANAEHYCTKKTEYAKGGGEEEQKCRDMLLEGCVGQLTALRHTQELLQLSGETTDGRAEKARQCEEEEMWHCADIDCEHEKIMCESTVKTTCYTRVWKENMKAGHLKKVIMRHGHPKGDEFDHNDEL